MSVEQSIEFIRGKLDELDYKAKRKVLDMLGIKVWLDGENIEICGIIPIMDGGIVNSPS